MSKNLISLKYWKNFCDFRNLETEGFSYESLGHFTELLVYISGDNLPANMLGEFIESYGPNVK